MEVEALVAIEPGTHLEMLIGGVVVEDVTALRRCLERIVPPREAREAAFEPVTVMRLMIWSSDKSV